MSYHDILPAELTDLFAEAELLIFDIRDASSYARAHIDNAQPASDEALKSLLKSRQRQRPILVYCYHGHSSRDICQFIAGFGFERVHNLVGGWQAWEQFIDTESAASGSATPSPALMDWMTEQGFPSTDMHSSIENGMTPLMIAALKGEQEKLEELLALGANPNHLNDDRHHALWFACVHGSPERVATLIAHGADLDNQNINGATCAIYAASTGKLEALKCLVEAGANLSLETNIGYNALENASSLPVLKYLKQRMKDRLVLPAE
jgi:thiosulfate/3-mercaptopyruvate sulfurtransferase